MTECVHPTTCQPSQEVPPREQYLTVKGVIESPLKGSPKMTVKELREKLAGLDDKTDVVVYWEADNEQRFFEIDDISTVKGRRNRVGGKPAFTFDRNGPDTCLFITISPDE